LHFADEGVIESAAAKKRNPRDTDERSLKVLRGGVRVVRRCNFLSVVAASEWSAITIAESDG
jgi:hypothetical protein